MKTQFLFSSLLLFMGLLPVSYADTNASSSFTVQLPAPGVSSQSIHAAFPSLKIHALFSETEKKLLRTLHRDQLAETLLLGPVGAADAINFGDQFALHFPGAKLEKNDSLSFSSISSLAPTPTPAATPSADPLYSQQWALKNTAQDVRVDLDDLRTTGLSTVAGEDLNLPPASSLSGMHDVVVAVLDTGLDVTHPDLRGSLRSKPAECAVLTKYLECLNTLATATPAVPDAAAETQCLAQVGNTDTDHNGYPMDCVGWSVTSSLSDVPNSPLSAVLGTPDMDDGLGHGTHVAGIIAASANNGMGISGIAQNVKILPVRVIDTPPTSPLRPQSLQIPSPNEASLGLGKSSVELIARGMLYAITEHVQVINMSLGWPATVNSGIIASMIQLAQEQGIAVVAAAGNDSTDALVLPCSFPGVICVGSYGPDGLRAPYSNRGPGVDLLAPGTSILSTYPLALRARFFTDLQGYEFISGTSMSAPMVSGSLAILLGKGFSLDESLARMLASARVSGPALGENLRLDLGKSLTQTPRPYLHVTERAAIRMPWKNAGETLHANFHAKNLWKNIRACSVQYRLSPALNTVTDATLEKFVSTSTQMASCGNFASGEERSFNFPIDLHGVRASRDFILNADFHYTSETGESFAQTLQVNVEIVPSPELISSVLPVQNIQIDGQPVGNGTMVRTVVAADSKSAYAKPEYIVMSRLTDGIAIQLMSARNTQNYTYSTAQKLTDLSWSFLVAQRFYSAEAQATRVAILTRKTSDISGLTQIRFDIYDEKLQTLIRTVNYDGSFAPLPENFRWTSLGGKDAMVFISNGKEPPSDDVWHQIPDVTVQLRCYVLDSAGKLSWIKVNTLDPEIRIVDFLPMRSEDTEKNETALLMIRGKDYGLSYFIGHFKEGAIASKDPFEIQPYRNMGFLSGSPFLSDQGPGSSNTLSSNVGRGHMRSTVLMRTGYAAVSNGDYRFSAIDAQDGVSGVVGGFNLSGVNSFFTQTNYDLQFHEFTAGGENVIRTSMNRFSFLPTTISQRAFYPVLVKNELGKSEASVLTADIGSGFFNLSAILPERNADGKAVGLLRPALLSFEGNASGCSFIGNPVWDSVGGVYRMNSFCGSAVRSVALAMPSTP